MKNIFRLVRCSRGLDSLSGFFFVVFCIFTTTNPLHAQWVQTSGPYGGNIKCFAVSGTNLFAGISGSGVFLSTNNGTSWTEVNSGLTTTDVYSLAVSGTNLFAGTGIGGSVFRSTNNGTSWTADTVGLAAYYVNSLAVLGTSLFAGTDMGVFRSTNDGTVGLRSMRGCRRTPLSTLLSSRAQISSQPPGATVYFVRPTTAQAGRRLVPHGSTTVFPVSLPTGRISLWGLRVSAVFVPPTTVQVGRLSIPPREAQMFLLSL